MAGVGINPYKLAYALTIALLIWAAGFWPLEGAAGFWLLLFSWLLAHFSFLWFKKLVFRNVIALDMNGVVTSGQFYTEEIKPERRMVRLVIALRRKYATALLSNNNALFAYGARRILPMDAMFDYEYYSSQLGAAKPDEATYRRFADYVSVHPSRVIFVDDKKENVEAARRVGMIGIVCQNAEQVREELARYGVRP